MCHLHCLFHYSIILKNLKDPSAPKEFLCKDRSILNTIRVMVTHEYQTLCCYTSFSPQYRDSDILYKTLQVCLKSFICILLVGSSEKTSGSDSAQNTTHSKAFCISVQECFVRIGKTGPRLSSSQTAFQLTPFRQCTKLTAQPTYHLLF